MAQLSNDFKILRIACQYTMHSTNFLDGMTTELDVLDEWSFMEIELKMNF